MVLPRPERAALRLSWAGLAAALSVVLLVGRVDANGSLADVTCATNCTARCSRTSDCDSGCCMLACDNCVDDQCALCVACSAEACRGRCDPEVCTARCELRQWLTCSTGATGGCAFHDGNAHLELAKTWLESLRSQGLRGDECFHALHTGQLPARMVGCRECAPYLARVVQGLSAAAQLAVRSDSGIPVTPKEALIHLQRCACAAPALEPRAEKFSDHLLDDVQDGDVEDTCIYFGWLRTVSGGSGAYTASSTLAQLVWALEDRSARGFHLFSLAESGSGAWLGWWEAVGDGRSQSAWIVEEDAEAFVEALEASRAEGFVATTIAHGAGAWVAWLIEAPELSSRWVSAGSVVELRGELRAAADRGERLQTLAHGPQGRWVAWFTTRTMEDVGKSTYIITPLKRDLETFSKRMVDQGYYATAAAFGDGTFVAWFESDSPGSTSVFAAERRGLDFLLSLDRALDRGSWMATAMAWGCFEGP